MVAQRWDVSGTSVTSRTGAVFSSSKRVATCHFTVVDFSSKPTAMIQGDSEFDNPEIREFSPCSLRNETSIRCSPSPPTSTPRGRGGKDLLPLSPGERGLGSEGE